MFFATFRSLLADTGLENVTDFLETPLGKLVVFLFCCVFIPVFSYLLVKRFVAAKRVFKILDSLARHNKFFVWRNIRENITATFLTVHKAWSAQDLTPVNDMLTAKFLADPAHKFDNDWAEKGFANFCKVEFITMIKPLYFSLYTRDNCNGTRLVAMIGAVVRDYLYEVESGAIVEGDPNFKSIDNIWTFVLQDGKWLVENIEESLFELEYANLMKKAPSNLDKIIDSLAPGKNII